MLSSLQAFFSKLFGSNSDNEAGIESENDSEYQSRIASELENFNDCTNVHELPEIFHYWSNKHLAPLKFHQFGITDPEQFFFLYVQNFQESHPDQMIQIVSLGSGNCDMEARLAKKLSEQGLSTFVIDCIDINETMLERGRQHAAEQRVEKHINPIAGDFNHWEPVKSYDIVMANQCLHHVVELENLFTATKKAMHAESYFLTSDMIGRNGHQRWPEALALVNEFWEELPEPYRYNQLLKRQEVQYINHDCSEHSFEGIRAQDILPLLTEMFHFELFLPFANLVTVFIDRPFGHNFDAQGEWDRDFIDRVHARDEEAILAGDIKPTQMLAVLRKEAIEPVLLEPHLTPEFCIRRPD
jgi:SAM-dependent methyltransferase